jgi:hypothetical protein
MCSITIGFTICTVVFIYSPVIPPEWRNLFLEPTVTVASVMACRLFRELKLGVFADTMTEGAFSTLVLTDMGHISQRQSSSETGVPGILGDVGGPGSV